METDRSKIIACVTGASGMIGRRIVQRLLSNGYKVRVLSRQGKYCDSRVELFTGGLENEDVLERFISTAHLLFHCAAELHNESKMWDVNVVGTERLLRLAKKSGIKFFCHLSSAGVVGRTNVLTVDENTECNPQNMYERSKYAAEKCVLDEMNMCEVVILRPTNVISIERPGILAAMISDSFIDRIKCIIKSSECTHIVHADDVAAAACYLINHFSGSPQCYYVSCDYDRMNTYAQVYEMARSMTEENRRHLNYARVHIPALIPRIMRRMLGGNANSGLVRFSSDKLLATGFRYECGLRGAVERVVEGTR
jgi:nucleoside-diphosphate-sugar epimerase